MNSDNMVKIIQKCEQEIRNLYTKMHEEKNKVKQDKIYDEIYELKVLLKIMLK